MATRKALIIKVGAIGDAIMALPLARELAQQGASVSWLAGNDIAPLVAMAPEISRLILVDQQKLFSASKLAAAGEVFRTWWQLRGSDFNEIYLLHADKRYRYLVPPQLRSRIRPVRAGARRHHTFEYTRLAYPEIEDRELKFEPYTLAPVAARGQRICLFPGGARNAMRDDPLRRWPVEHYAVVAEELVKLGYEVAVLGGPSDQWIEPSFAHLRGRLEWLVGTLSLAQTVELLRHARLAFSHDTGPLHLATMADCPVITIFGSTNSEWVGPLRYKHLIVERSPKLPCQPCYDGKNYTSVCTNNICLSGIGPDVVLAKALSALGDVR